MDEPRIRNFPVTSNTMGVSIVPLSQTPSICIVEPSAKDVFVFWEKMRLIYNAVVLVATFYVVFPFAEQIMGEQVTLERAEVLVVPLLWNICYGVGPVGEGYLCMSGIPRRLARWSLLMLGTVVMLVITGAIVINPDMRRMALELS